MRPAQRAVTSATLTAFNSCQDALSALRKAAQASITQYGLPTEGMATDRGEFPAADGAAAAAPSAAAAAPAAAPAGGASAPAYSGTNDYTAGVDEPDLVKTDGSRIVTVSGNTLEVIDAASHQVTGTLNLTSAGISGGTVNLLLSGSHALLIAQNTVFFGGADPGVDQYGPRFLLVDLTGSPRVLASYTIDGNLIDARQVGSVVRIVTQYAPVIRFPDLPDGTSNAGRMAAYRAAAGSAGLDAWLPSYAATESDGAVISGSVPCTAISRPKTFSGTNLLTVLTFDASATSFGSGDPVSVVADGDTVYGTASSLYVASGGQTGPFGGAGGPVGYVSGPAAVRQETQIYRFDITGQGAPRYAASGTVPGYLINQYAMSEWNGFLRVATTTGTSWALADGRPAGARASSSAVYELTTAGHAMRIVGNVTGLGSEERIYAVRFMGPVGYVVTFRQTDPLYTLDLTDPSHPHAVGALGLTGYSAYLQPVSATRLVGIGQQADAQGHVLGTQVSLFDVANLAAPARLSTYALASSTSAAELDPHAFLYWPADGLVVVPLQTSGPVSGSSAQPSQGPQTGALVLRLSGDRIAVDGFIGQPQTGSYPGSAIERSLIIGQTLWTVSPAGVMASDLTTLHQQAWLPFTSVPPIYPNQSMAPAAAES